MELVNFDEKTITVKMIRRSEYARLLAILQTVNMQYDRFDKELLMLSENEVKELADAVFDMDEKITVPKK